MTKQAEGKVQKARWYVVQSQSNYEKRVQSLIREQVLLQNKQDLVEEVLIPTEQVVEVKKGVKNNSERKFFPGYVLIKCVMTDDVWHLIKSVPHITNFVGAEQGRKPLPISQKEADNILRQMEEGVDKPRNLVDYEAGEEVRVIDGPFNSFQGVVEEVDLEKERLKVSVSIFGRATPIELDFSQVEKI
ncbi:MAG: transcription termination/antitermination protein NusG [Alphaproteobacteria bacterium]|nr:transcription termination/antitermination protein NusG [Alphaproteobacteria bacterium]MDD9920264.1 transcription termination/antitermination protein NusG [Alphaproteobacteria bacterium]